MATADARVRLGDRLERAIEERTDVEGAIERGTAEQRPRSGLKRTLVPRRLFTLPSFSSLLVGLPRL